MAIVAPNVLLAECMLCQRGLQSSDRKERERATQTVLLWSAWGADGQCTARRESHIRYYRSATQGTRVATSLEGQSGIEEGNELRYSSVPRGTHRCGGGALSLFVFVGPAFARGDYLYQAKNACRQLRLPCVCEAT